MLHTLQVWTSRSVVTQGAPKLHNPPGTCAKWNIRSYPCGESTAGPPSLSVHYAHMAGCRGTAVVYMSSPPPQRCLSITRLARGPARPGPTPGASHLLTKCRHTAGSYVSMLPAWATAHIGSGGRVCRPSCSHCSLAGRAHRRTCRAMRPTTTSNSTACFHVTSSLPSRRSRRLCAGAHACFDCVCVGWLTQTFHTPHAPRRARRRPRGPGALTRPRAAR